MTRANAMNDGGDELPLRHALALGLLHGPSELLPISSSGHTTLIPWLAGWPYSRLDPQLRKSFEVALHAGTAAALLLRPPTPWAPRARRAFLAAALAPPVAAGYALHARIEQRLGTPHTISAGLLIGSLAIVSAEARARRAGATRASDAAGACDGLALGAAQALALAPGISRSGATFAAARARGFDPQSADRLSWQAGLPVICAAAALQASRLARRGAPAGMRLAFAVGTAGAFASTLLAGRALDGRRRARAVLPAAAYRVGLARVAIGRARS